MSLMDKITNALGIYAEDDEELEELEAQAAEEEEEAARKAKEAEKPVRRRPFGGSEPRIAEEPVREFPHSKAPAATAVLPAQPVTEAPAPAPAPKPAKRRSIFSSKRVQREENGNKTINIPLNERNIKVVVLEPTSFDDSQKVADYLRNSQPVVLNFEGTDKVIKRRMIDFISGTIYALSGSVKQIGPNILVCAPKNVDVDADAQAGYGVGENPWQK